MYILFKDMTTLLVILGIHWMMLSKDMVFWLIGANAPIMKVHFKCILKN
jgi:hypothetical protein